MTKETKMIEQVTVEKIQFRADDGNLFDDEFDAKWQNKKLAELNAPLKPDINKFREQWRKKTIYPSQGNPVVISQVMDYDDDEIDNPERLKITSDPGWLRASMDILINLNIPINTRDNRIKDHIIKTNDGVAAYGFMRKYMSGYYLDDGLTEYE